MARAALSSDSLASLVISSRSAFSWLSSPSNFLLSIGHSSSLAVSSHLGVSSSRLRSRLLIHLQLGVTDLQSILLDGGLGLSIASNGVLKSQAKISCISFQLLLHPQGLGLALGLSLEGSLHRVQRLRLGLLDQKEFFLLLSQATFDLLSDSIKLQLASQHLILFLFQSGLSLLQGRLQLQFLSLKTLPNFVNLMDGAASFADLVHDVLDLVGEGFILPANFFQLEDSFLISRLHLEQFRRSIASLLLGDIKIEGETINLSLPFANNLVKLLGLPFHSSIEHLGLIQGIAHLIGFSSNLSLSLLNLGQFGIEIVNGCLSLSEPGIKLHLGHLELLRLSNSINLILLTPCACLTLSLSNKSENILTSSSFTIKSLSGSIQLMLQVTVLA